MFFYSPAVWQETQAGLQQNSGSEPARNILEIVSVLSQQRLVQSD